MYPVSTRFLEALRGPHTAVVQIEAWRADRKLKVDFAGARGNVSIDADSGARRRLNVSLPPAPGLWELLSPVGTEIHPFRGIRFPDGSREIVPLGKFPVDEQTMGYGGDDGLQITAPDRWVQVQRARFLTPQQSTAGLTVAGQIVALLRGALGLNFPIVSTASSTAPVGALVWERDRDRAILELAKSIGAEVFFAADGSAVVRDAPDLSSSPVWLANAGRGGVLTAASRRRSRTRTYNVVVAAPAQVDGTVPFPPVRVGDQEPTSQTYAGPAPFTDPAKAGPFGIVPYFFTSELLGSTSQATQAANTMLQRVRGLAAQLSLSQVVNPAVEAGDVWDVVLPPETALSPQPVERHIVDSATVPLTVEDPQTVDTRSTRPDDDTERTE